MTWKCYWGQPIEFKAKYEGVVTKKWEGPDTSPVYGLVMKNFNWLKPDKIHIGKGFYVEPDLPHGIKHYGPDSSYDLELTVTGPGLPKNGQRVTFKWGLSPCFGVPATNTICKQFLNVEIVTSKSGASKYTIEFVSGYTEQQFIKGWNVATWRICYDGPFEMMVLAPLPDKWQLQRIPFWIEVLIGKIEECGDTPGCDLNMEPPMDTIDGVITQLKEIPVSEDLEKQCQEISRGLEQTKGELSEADSLVKRSSEVTSEKERLELRAVAIDHLQIARDLNSEAIELLLRLQEVLAGKRRGDRGC